jgi:hypothetical protein
MKLVKEIVQIIVWHIGWWLVRLSCNHTQRKEVYVNHDENDHSICEDCGKDFGPILD